MREVNVFDIKRISDVRVGDVFTTRRCGKGLVIGVTKRTITVKFENSTSKNTYKSSECEYPLNEF